MKQALSLAVSAVYPQDETSSARPVRSFSSSSTISTFSWLMLSVHYSGSQRVLQAATRNLTDSAGRAFMNP